MITDDKHNFRYSSHSKFTINSAVESLDGEIYLHFSSRYEEIRELWQLHKHNSCKLPAKSFCSIIIKQCFHFSLFSIQTFFVGWIHIPLCLSLADFLLFQLFEYLLWGKIFFTRIINIFLFGAFSYLLLHSIYYLLSFV